MVTEFNSVWQEPSSRALRKIRRHVPAVSNPPRRTEIPLWAERLGAAFAARRETDGWTARALAERAGVPYDSVLKYLSGRVEHPRGDRLDRLCAAIGVDSAWLFGFDEGGRAPGFIDEAPKPDPGPLDERATVRTLRAVLDALMTVPGAEAVSEPKLLAAAHSASDAWRALARQGHDLDAAFAPTLQSFFRRGEGPPRDEIQYAAEVAADIYRAMLPLNALDGAA